MRALLAVINVLLALSVLPWPLLLISTPFMFDAPGSESSPITIALALSVVVYPLPTIAGNIGFWIHFRRRQQRSMVIYTLLGISGWALVVALFVALDVVCGGRFSCS